VTQRKAKHDGNEIDEEASEGAFEGGTGIHEAAATV
jgi:hypothetical protein